MYCWVIRRTSDGFFVTPPGQKRSYARDLMKARTFTTREAADAECCVENERVVYIGDVMEDRR